MQAGNDLKKKAPQPALHLIFLKFSQKKLKRTRMQPVPQLGPLVTRLMTWAQMRGIERATSAEVSTALRLTNVQCRQLLDRLNKRGMIVQLQRGLYLLPAKLPPGGKWTPAPQVILRHLFEAKGSDWQETGAGAFHFHGLTEQVPNTTTVYNTLFSGRDRIAGLDFEMIKVTPSRMGAAQDSAGRRVGNLGRVVMDAVFDSARFGTLPKAYLWIRERSANKAFLDDLTESAILQGDGPTRRRLGCVLELLETDGNRLEKLEKSILPFRTFIPLVPGGDRRGHTNKKWGIILNHTDWLHE